MFIKIIDIHGMIFKIWLLVAVARSLISATLTVKFKEKTHLAA